LLATKKNLKDRNSPPIYRYILQMRPQGEDISVEGIIDLAANKGSFSLAAPSLDLNRFMGLVGLTPQTISVGHGSFLSRGRINLMPFQLVEAQVTCDLEPILFRRIPLKLGSPAAAADKKPAISYDFKTEHDQWLMEAKVAISEPLIASVNLNNTVTRKKDGGHSSGNFQIKVLTPPDSPARPQALQFLKKIPELAGIFAIDFDQNGTWQASVKTKSQETQGNQSEALQVEFDNIVLNTALPTLILEGSGNLQQDKLDLSLAITVSRVEIFDTDNNITIKNISGRIPWQWPVSEKVSSGEITLAGISFGNYDLGSFRGGVRLQGMTYLLEGSHASSLLPGITTNVSGMAGIIGSSLQAEFAAHIVPTPLASLPLGRFHPSLSKSYFSGVLGLESSMLFAPSGYEGKLLVRVQQGRIENSEKKYTLEGIDISVLLPSLPDLRSSPAQKILFKKATAENLVFEDGRITWQLESPESVFIEEGVFRWAGGRVFTNAVRLSPDIKNMVIPIFCDRLRLADLLEQFGVSNAQGEGTVNGRIPLTVGKNKIHFEDGFLYSSPGQGGSIRVKAFDLLATGIPKNTPQFVQVDFAAEALKNFSYNWVKLLFNSEGEELYVQMQMDGKPMQSLPFRYDSTTGLLQRIENGGQGIKQPIRLDVNFRLPLNRFLGYSGRIQDIMNKIR
ncbi:MAG: YdbH domain-containing protein, partial [Deltaproteobacteria bacterium]|nr:YdbH domain-containing protein [Deltaproteobacteria bacterium]